MRFRRYLPGFVARGLDVEIFTGTPTVVKARMAGAEVDWRSVPPGKRLPDVELDGVPLRRVRLPDEKSLWRSVVLARALERHCRSTDQRPDVLQFISFSPFSVPWVRKIRGMGIGTVLTKTMVAELPEVRWRRALVRLRQRFTAQAVDCVVASTEVMRRGLREMGVKNRIEIIGNGVDLDRFQPPRNGDERREIGKLLGLEPEDRILLFVGGVSPRKGVDVLLEAWCHLAEDAPPAHLVIVGPRKDKLNPEDARFHDRLVRLQQRSGAADRVHFVGYREAVERWMRAADIFVFASRREGMGNVVLEAMASGLPVILTPFVGLSTEFGRTGEHFLLAEREGPDLAKTIRRLLRDPDRARTLGRAARRWAEQRLGVEASLDRYAALYRDLARESPSGERGSIRRHPGYESPRVARPGGSHVWS